MRGRGLGREAAGHARACAPIAPVVRKALHVSIVAGVPTSSLVQWLGVDRVIRAMPNTPALIGAGVTAMLATPGTSRADRALAQEILAATGYTFWVDSDERIDAVTALSGSGPGFVFEHAVREAVASAHERARSLSAGPSA